MRIRTVKPEFWSHPVMVRQSDATKLLAIGLLNLADDEGYFYADPRMIRAALRPLDEDSMTVHGSITELSRITYIEVRTHPTHGPVGRVISFSSHQVVNRGRDSIIKPLFTEAAADSVIDHGAITESSLPEQGTREQGRGSVKRRAPRRKAPAVSISDLALPNELTEVHDFPAQFRDFVEHRKQIGAELTAQAANLILADLAERPQQAVDGLKLAIKAGWRGFEWAWFDKRRGASNSESQPSISQEW